MYKDKQGLELVQYMPTAPLSRTCIQSKHIVTSPSFIPLLQVKTNQILYCSSFSGVYFNLFSLPLYCRSLSPE